MAPVEVTLHAAVTWTGKGTAGVKWWLLDLGAEVTRETVVSQTIKLTLDPVTLDIEGNIVIVFIEAEGDADTPKGDGSVALDDED